MTSKAGPNTAQFFFEVPDTYAQYEISGTYGTSTKQDECFTVIRVGLAGALNGGPVERAFVAEAEADLKRQLEEAYPGLRFES
ncbi:MAG: hypothetical protein ACYDEV_08895 [Acidiferrobacter sp.]